MYCTCLIFIQIITFYILFYFILNSVIILLIFVHIFYWTIYLNLSANLYPFILFSFFTIPFSASFVILYTILYFVLVQGCVLFLPFFLVSHVSYFIYFLFFSLNLFVSFFLINLILLIFRCSWYFCFRFVLFFICTFHFILINIPFPMFFIINFINRLFSCYPPFPWFNTFTHFIPYFLVILCYIFAFIFCDGSTFIFLVCTVRYPFLFVGFSLMWFLLFIQYFFDFLSILYCIWFVYNTIGLFLLKNFSNYPSFTFHFCVHTCLGRLSFLVSLLLFIFSFNLSIIYFLLCHLLVFPFQLL